MRNGTMSEDERVLLFAWKRWGPNGGASDYRGEFTSANAATLSLKHETEHAMDAQIVQLLPSGRMVHRWHGDNYDHDGPLKWEWWKTDEQGYGIPEVER